MEWVPQTGYNAIPGGLYLHTRSLAQSAMGMYNQTRTDLTFDATKTRSSLPDANDWLFMLGNGSSVDDRSNAFEVSYNGHSIVNDWNGRGSTVGGRAAIEVRRTKTTFVTDGVMLIAQGERSIMTSERRAC